MKSWMNTHVRHALDSHGRAEGTVVGEVQRGRFTLVKVLWDSGVTETIDPGELRPKDGGLLLSGESPRQARDRINGFRKD